MNVASPPSGILDPKQPWYNGKVGDRTWDSLKAKLTGGKDSSGTQYSSFVNLTNADADKLIKNLKKYGKYPQVNQTGGAGGYENLQKYQEWLVEEFLEKPFQQQTNQKIEDAAIESRLKEIQEQKKQKAQSFISGATPSAQVNKVSAKTTTISSIVPKKTVPQEVVDKIIPQSTADGGENETVVSPSKKVVSSLGRLTLDLVQINDNLDKIKDVIAEDYNQTKEKNKKEIEDYRKRVANKGRKFSKKDLGNDKRSLKDIIKPFVGGFFSGVGGSIRSLAAFNLLDALVSDNPLKAFQSLMGIGITFIPQIGTMIAGAVLKSLLKGFGKGVVGGGGMRGGPMRSPRGVGGGIGKFGSMMALGTGALALGGAYLASQQDETDPQATDGQTRLEQVTAEQKALTEKGLVSITQDDLKKFQNLNIKFEKTLDILMSKSRTGITTDVTNKSPANLTPGTANMSPADLGQVTDAVKDPNVKAFLDTISNVESAGKYNVSVGGSTFTDMSKHPEMYNSELGSDAAGRYQFISTTFKPIAQRLGLTDFSPRSQDLAAVQYLKDLGVLDEIQTGDPAKIEDVINRLKGSKWTGLQKYGSGQGSEFFQKRKQTYKSLAPTAQPKPAAANPEISANPASSGRSIAILPIPNLTGTNGPGSFNNNGSGDVASVDPRNPYDVYGRINRTGLNVVDVG
jgi:muramidase (phage lysozyme)